MTDAERLAYLREWHLTPKGTHEGWEECDKCFLLIQLDTANKTIAEKDAEIERLRDGILSGRYVAKGRNK